MGVFPMTYLGLPLGDNLRKIAFWSSVEDKVRKRLAFWKRSFFTKEGRLALL